MFNLTHPSAEKLSKKLLKLNPEMNSVFFSDNGSTAMEIAIKIALQYWHNVGENKKQTLLLWKMDIMGIPLVRCL